MNSRSREGFYLLWTVAILVCLAACLFLLAYVSFTGGGKAPAAEQSPASDDAALPDDAAAADGALPADGTVTADMGQEGTVPAQDGTVPAEVTDVPAPTDAPQAASTVLAETADLGQEYQDKLVFLGDSTTYGLYTYSVLPHYQVWVPANGTLSLFNWEIETIDYYGRDGSNQRLSIPDCASTAQPEYLIITLGVNGIDILNESQFKDYYRRLVQAIQTASPNTRIMCQSIYPVIDSMAPSGINNASINEANQWILSVAEELGVRYLNTHDALLDSSNQLIKELNSGDGLHVTPEGYNRILTYVRTHGYQ